MDLHFRLKWRSEKEKRFGIQKELNELKETFKSNTGDYMAFDEGELKFGTPLKMSRKEVKSKLQEKYPQQKIKTKNGAFIIRL